MLKAFRHRLNTPYYRMKSAVGYMRRRNATMALFFIRMTLKDIVFVVFGTYDPLGRLG